MTSNTIVDLQDVLPDIFDEPPHLAQSLVGRILVMPFIFPGHDADGVRHGFAVAGYNDVPYPHFLDESCQNAPAPEREVGFFRDVLAVAIPAYPDMIVGEAF